mmetsp:Transcript_37168/g.83720  ORF Transcript_37168/g.83720 Transcript_37168/m.83720 type:complete len:380 (-) Transcript_37168:75-1214(-)
MLSSMNFCATTNGFSPLLYPILSFRTPPAGTSTSTSKTWSYRAPSTVPAFSFVPVTSPTSIQVPDDSDHCAAIATPDLLKTWTCPSDRPRVSAFISHWGSFAISSGDGPVEREALDSATAFSKPAIASDDANLDGSLVKIRMWPSWHAEMKSGHPEGPTGDTRQTQPGWPSVWTARPAPETSQTTTFPSSVPAATAFDFGPPTTQTERSMGRSDPGHASVATESPVSADRTLTVPSLLHVYTESVSGSYATSLIGPSWSSETLLDSSCFTDVPSGHSVSLQTRTAWPVMPPPLATPALVVTTLRDPSAPAGSPATLTVFSCPPIVPMQNAPASDGEAAAAAGGILQTLAVPSQLPLTSHGAPPEPAAGGTHDRLVTAFA